MNIYKVLLVLFLMLGMAVNANAAAYVKLGDIKGESTDNEHKDWIIIESMSSPLFTAQTGSDTGSCQLNLPPRGDTTPGDVVIVRELDRSSVKLQQASCDGVQFDEAIIDLVSSKRRGSEPYLRYKLKDVIVTSYSVGPGTNSTGDTVPMESISLNFSKVEFEYVKGKHDRD
ncbi:Hcp family type VI secretion system effector [Shewanella atlantica]|nr:type VI secretion system tube protein Hcp [Shewanella atlantica]